MTQMVNMLVELDERFDEAARTTAHAEIERAGYTFYDRHSADDRTLAWIDDVFGGSWSSEVNLGSNCVAASESAAVGFATYDTAGMRYAWLRGAATEGGVSIFGPVGVDPDHRKRGLGARLVIAALGSMRGRGATRALIPAVGESLVPFYANTVGARVVEHFDLAALTPKPVRTVVLASGNGSNFQAVLDRIASATLPLDVTALVCNDPAALAIGRARDAGLANVHVLPWERATTSRAQYDAKLLEIVGAERPELVLLLGWMHLLHGAFVYAFPELLNVHPAFLPLDSTFDVVGLPDGTEMPAFRGAHAIRDALAAGSAWVGASVHVVTPETDRGPILARKPLRVQAGESEEALLGRLHPIEHGLLERGIKRWLYER